MQSFSATDLSTKTGDVLAVAAQEAVEIKRHGKARFVVLSVEQYERLTTRGDTRRSIHIDDMSDAKSAALVAELEEAIKDD